MKAIKRTTLRTQSRALFPTWSRRQRAKWVLAKLYVMGRHSFPIGYKSVAPDVPDFLRVMPRFQPLTIVHTSADVVCDVKRMVREMFK